MKYTVSIGAPNNGFFGSGTHPEYYFDLFANKEQKPNASFDTEYMFKFSQSLNQKRKLFLNVGFGFGQTFYELRYPKGGNQKLNESFHSIYNYRFLPSLGLEKRINLGEDLQISFGIDWAPRIYKDYTREFENEEALVFSENSSVSYSVQFKNKKEQYKVENNPIILFRYLLSLNYKINDQLDLIVQFQMNRNFNEYFSFRVAETTIGDTLKVNAYGSPNIHYQDHVVDSEKITTHFSYIGIGIKQRLNWTKFKENLLVH
ncbi:hypothetical protein [Brumimicrobium aurantiacum]|nr:hypothetical protein [Brumimicrobium aurantiacum]